MFKAVVILNGPSSRSWLGHKFHVPLYGCNWAYREFDLDYCCVIDTEMCRALSHEPQPPGCAFYTKTLTPQQIGPSWIQRRPAPGIDSGSMALDLAQSHGHDPILIIGGDGQLGQDVVSVYDYSWQRRAQTSRIYQLHQHSFRRLCSQGSVTWVSEQPHDHYQTMPFREAIKWV